MRSLIRKYYILLIAILFGILFISPNAFAKKHRSRGRAKTHKVTKKSKKRSRSRVRYRVSSRIIEIEEDDDTSTYSVQAPEGTGIAGVNASDFEDADSLDEDSLDEDEPKGVVDDEEVVVKDKNGHEEFIEVPEGLITDSEKGDQPDYLEKRYLSEDTTSVVPGVNPFFEDSVYIDRLKRMPTAIEMPWNPVVQKFIDRYTGRLRHSVSMMLGASNFYMPIFEQALEVYDIPLELKYLPVIESALKPSATSRVGAAGQWQFMIATGKRYGLKVNSMIDERRDPVKASYAAAHYLNDLYQIFGNWNLVIAAYNCGPGNILKAIQRSGGKHDFWEIYPYLPSETRGYVPAFIAANYIMTYYCEHNIAPMTATLPEETDTIMLFQNLHFKQVSEVLDISMDELRALNPQYRHDVVTGYSEPTDLRLPKAYISKFIEHENEIKDYDVSDLMKRDVVEVNTSSGYHRYSFKRRAYRSHSNRLLSHKHKKSKKSKRSKRRRRRR